jgi:hypothetical protein
MKQRRISVELYALFLSNQTVMQILDKMPRGDLVEEAMEILLDQAEILQARIDGCKIVDHDLSTFIDDCNDIFDSYQQNNPLPKYDN